MGRQPRRQHLRYSEDLSKTVGEGVQEDFGEGRLIQSCLNFRKGFASDEDITTMKVSAF